MRPMGEVGGMGMGQGQRLPRIAVVTDDAMLLGSLAAMPERYEAFPILSPDAALSGFEREPFDLVLLDLDLCNGSGLSLLKHLRRVQPASEAIVLSDKTSADVVVSAMRLGACDFVPKPIGSADQLGQRIDDSLARGRGNG